jgi:hypothetical protein
MCRRVNQGGSLDSSDASRIEVVGDETKGEEELGQAWPPLVDSPIALGMLCAWHSSLSR